MMIIKKIILLIVKNQLFLNLFLVLNSFTLIVTDYTDIKNISYFALFMFALLK